MRPINSCIPLVALLAGLASCTALLGDDFEIVGENGGGGSAGNGGGGGVGGSGATGGSTGCEPDTTTCADETTLRECSSEGVPTDTPCPADTPTCAAGACVACSAGDRTCVGHDVVECADGTFSSVVETCAVDCAVDTCITAVDVGVGTARSCAVMSNGTVRCWGYSAFALLYMEQVDDPAQVGTYVTVPTVVAGVSNAVSVGTGIGHGCALTSDDTVQCWGWNGVGQLGTGGFLDAPEAVTVTLADAVADLSVGYAQTCTALANGHISCWGLNENGQLGIGPPVEDFVPTPQDVWLGVPAATVSTMNGHSCALTTASEAACWGDNSDGQLGQGDTTAQPSPVGIGGEGVQEIRAGGSFTCMRTVGTTRCCGRNINGQLGTGVSGSDVLSPTDATDVGTVKRLDLGEAHGCAIGNDDVLRCWGDDEFGQVGDGRSGPGIKTPEPYVHTALGAVTDVAAGYAHTCAVTAAGEVYCWGINNHGQLGNGDTTLSSSPVRVVW